MENIDHNPKPDIFGDVKDVLSTNIIEHGEGRNGVINDLAEAIRAIAESCIPEGFSRLTK